MRRWLVSSILSFSCLSFSSISAAQQLPLVLVPGAPLNSAVAFQDGLGRLWLTTEHGPQMFDGVRSYSFEKAGSPGAFARSFGNSLAEDDEGGIWSVSADGVYRLKDGRFTRMLRGSAESVVRLAPGLMVASVGSVSELYLWRFRRRGDSWKADRLSDWRVRPQGRVTVDHRGNVLYPCLNAWCEVPRETIAKWRLDSKEQPIRHPDVYPGIEIVLRDRDGCVWFRSPGGAKYQCGSGAKPIPLPLEIASNGVGIEEAFDGSILLTSYLGIAIGRPHHFHVWTAQNGLPTSPGAAFLARDGTLWIAARKGLFRMPYATRLEFWGEREGVAGTFSILPTGDRTFASSGLGIAALSRDRTRWVELKASRNIGVVRNLIRGPENTLLAVLHRSGVAQLGFDGRILARSRPGADSEAMQLARTPDGQYWLAGSGVSRVQFHGETLNLLPEALPPPLTFGTDIQYEPHTQKLWACYAGGLIVKDGDSWKRITTRDGLLENACRSLDPVPDGDVWFGYFATRGFALVHPVPDGKPLVRQFEITSRAETPRITYFLRTDTRGWLWRASPAGILVADQTEARKGLWVSLNENDGLPAAGGNQQSFTSDSDGSVWWAADNFIIHFAPPSDFVHPAFAPAVSISGFSWQNSPPQFAAFVHNIPHGSRVIAHLGSLQFDRRSAMEIRYRLLPRQTEWREGGFDLDLGRMTWGSHTLEVEGRLFTGPWSAVQRDSFTILAPNWLGWPFLLAYVASLGTIAALAYHQRKRRVWLANLALPDLRDLRIAALSPEAHQVAGKVLDTRYEVGPVLARGGFATVLKGRDLRLGGRACAIKVFREELRDRAWTGRQFEREVSALENIRHPNVVDIYGHGVTPSGLFYLVMEFIDGQSLRDRLNAGPVAPCEAAAFLRQAASALSEIHAKGFVHRDLTPENLLIRSGRAADSLVLIDFSIALVKQADQALHGLSRAAGTFAYMAPEQALGCGFASSDIYSLSKIVVEMITGKRVADMVSGVSLDLAERLKELLRTLWSLELSQASIDLLASALEFDPRSRPQTVLEFALPVACDLEKMADRRL